MTEAFDEVLAWAKAAAKEPLYNLAKRTAEREKECERGDYQTARGTRRGFRSIDATLTNSCPVDTVHDWLLTALSGPKLNDLSVFT